MVSDLATLWSISHFRLLLLARFISNFGNGLAPIALAFGVLGLPGATASSLSIVMAAQMFPIVAFMLIGGVIADRFPRALIVGVTDIILSGFVIWNGYSLLQGNASVLTLAAVGFVGGSLSALWWPAFSGLVPEVVPEEYLQSANSIVALGSNMAMIAGTVTGGFIVATVGAGWGLIVDGFTFLIAGILIYQLRGLGRTRKVSENSPSVLQDLRHGWKEFSSRSWVVAVVACYSVVAMLTESVLVVVGPYHAKEVLGGAKPWSWILASLSFGMVSGVLISLRWRPSRPIVAGISSQFFLAAWMFAMGATNSIPILIVTAFLCGVSMDFFMVLWQTALQTNIPREALSRVASYDAFGSLFFAPLGLVVAGPIAARLGTEKTFEIFGALTLICISCVLLVPGVRALKSGKISTDDQLLDSAENPN